MASFRGILRTLLRPGAGLGKPVPRVAQRAFNNRNEPQRRHLQKKESPGREQDARQQNAGGERQNPRNQDAGDRVALHAGPVRYHRPGDGTVEHLRGADRESGLRSEFNDGGRRGLGRRALAVSEVPLPDFLGHRDHDPLVADHRAHPE